MSDYYKNLERKQNKGCWLVTSTTYENELVFRDEDFELTMVGAYLKECILRIPGIYPYVEINEFCIMPNHFHLLLTYNDKKCEKAELKTIIGQLKRKVGAKFDFRFWEDSFSRIEVRTVDQYDDYAYNIRINAKRWKEDKYYKE